MVFNTYEDLIQAVEERRADVLTLEVDLGQGYSEEYEEAKKELQQAKALNQFTGDQEFLSDNVTRLEAKVESLRPEPNLIWLRFSKLRVGEWAALLKQHSLSPLDQYEKVLPKTFLGVWGKDPASGDDIPPLTTDHTLVSTKNDESILPGGALHQVVQAFMAWQNSGGEVAIRPTKSGRD